MEQLKEKLLENNKQTYWVPDFVKVYYFFVANMDGFLFFVCYCVTLFLFYGEGW